MRARIGALDGVRGMAILLILALHSGYGPHFVGGGLGVDVFFVLSGFLITSLLLDERDRWGSVSLSSFYLRRVARLAPAILLTVAVGAMCYRSLPAGDLGGYLISVAYVLTYTANIAVSLQWSDLDGLAHTWSLAEEEQFYLIWPALLLLLLRLRRRWIAVALILAGVAISWLSLRYHHGPATLDGIAQAYFRPEARAGSLLVGGLLALLLRRQHVRRALAQPLVGLAGLMVLTVVVVATGRSSLDYLGTAIPVASLSAAVLIGHLAQVDRGALARLFGWAPLRWTGAVSYGAYLYSGLFNAATEHLMRSWSTPEVALVRTVAAIGLAAVSYYLVEQPIRTRAGIAISRRGTRLRGLAEAQVAG